MFGQSTKIEILITRLTEHFKIPLFLTSILFVLISAHYSLREPFFFRSELVAPVKTLQHFHFGFRYFWSDALWLRAIQDLDFCEKIGHGKVTFNNSNSYDVAGESIDKNSQFVDKTCQKNAWLFHVLDLTTDLDPKYLMAYSAGGIALSVILDDVGGASQIFDKGVAALPNDWRLSYKAAYHALFSEKDQAKAAKLMLRAAQNGAPDWVYVLAGRLSTDSGQKDLAYKILQEMESLQLDPKILERLRHKIEQSLGNMPPGS